jgi:hypothetical protein
VGLFDSGEEHPPSKILRYIITCVAFVAAVGGFSWYKLRFHKQERIAVTFLNDLASGNLQAAYGMWSHGPDYSFKDFLDDWGDNGYYGPVKSYHFDGTQNRTDGVVIVFEVSPYQPFPGNDVVQQSKTKQIRLWVQNDKSFVSDAPP